MKHCGPQECLLRRRASVLHVDFSAGREGGALCVAVVAPRVRDKGVDLAESRTSASADEFIPLTFAEVGAGEVLRSQCRKGDGAEASNCLAHTIFQLQLISATHQQYDGRKRARRGDVALREGGVGVCHAYASCVAHAVALP
eukprot:scaffold40413_cov38-Tisochrysis_lutea.AAC.3